MNALLVGARVTDAGVNRLRKLLPKCNITRKSSDEVGGSVEAWPARRIGFRSVRTGDVILAWDGQAGSLSYGVAPVISLSRRKKPSWRGLEALQLTGTLWKSLAELSETRVLTTIVGGRVVFERKEIP